MTVHSKREAERVCADLNGMYIKGRRTIVQISYAPRSRAADAPPPRTAVRPRTETTALVPRAVQRSVVVRTNVLLFRAILFREDPSLLKTNS